MQDKEEKVKIEEMVTTLYRRGVTIDDIRGIYYALEAQEDAEHDRLFGNDEEGQHGSGSTECGE